ncbi:MAG: 2-succinyl-5-enolpyruvyl-6-hydroxy-3-cyclohexene-1-carboxylic-acid synthase [Rhodocyclaceae bacterium]
MNEAVRNLAWADAFIAALAAAGVRDAVLAPGARCAPLALAALRRPELTCHVINDERAAGYFALGLGKASDRPALVITTSGTASANLLPAIVEANLACVPLIVLTADRPLEMLGWGANQTIDQTKLYGEHVRAFHALPLPNDAIPVSWLSALAARLVTTALSPSPGPVHANLPFREPLLPEAIPAPPPLPPPIVSYRPAALMPASLETVAARLSGQPGVIVCGTANYPSGFADAIARLSAALDAPVIAEALSNLRCGPHDKSRFISHAARLLRHTELSQPAWVLRFGRFPVSRPIERWLARLGDAFHILVAPPGDWPDPLWRSTTRIEGDPLAIAQALASSCRSASAEFLQAWQAAETAVIMPDAFFEGSIARTLFTTLPAGSQCFVGNSLAIRAVDAFGGMRDAPLTLHGNRGASGIDGNLATAAGIAAATGAPTVALVGDQTVLHDATSLALCARHGVVVIVLNNHGGGIFEHLPFAAALPPALFERGWIAPQACDFAHLAAAFGIEYRQATTLDQLAAALVPPLGACLIEAVIDRHLSLKCFGA